MDQFDWTISSAYVISIYYIPSSITAQFPIMRRLKYQVISHTLYLTLHCARVLSSYTAIEMIEILNGQVGKRSVERIMYVIKFLVIVKY